MMSRYIYIDCVIVASVIFKSLEAHMVCRRYCTEICALGDMNTYLGTVWYVALHFTQLFELGIWWWATVE